MTTEKKVEEQKPEQQKTPRDFAEEALRRVWGKKTKADLIDELVKVHFHRIDSETEWGKKLAELTARVAELESITRNQYAERVVAHDEACQAGAMAEFWRKSCDMYRTIMLAKRFERMVADEDFQKFCEIIMRDGGTMATIDKIERAFPKMRVFVDEVRAAVEAEKAVAIQNAEKELKTLREWEPK